MLTEERFRTALAALIIAFSWSLAVSALADEPSPQTPVWLWSDSTPLSGAAAQAFGDGKYGAGMRLTHRALANAEDKRDRLIAHHNLCIAHATKAKTRAATRHCQEAWRLADKGFVIAGHSGTTAAEILSVNLAEIGMSGFGRVQ
ncbi:MAG: hypothetical protein HN793_13490 [Rhodospirillaceae bacterium]|nr:hypothetical protein [Rhodospirillaceae bacterium]MBT5241106.1 hypothetical protein [Rhodospirillaceae bacterium]MBT5566762.1 hypothetical protein [Rhodospirillaceae bacterium]MBT6090824.1 hypothetical protein [Rhodospirillaceae bacterium]MBT6961330.1 hypothetical protein [Rhodospirillaceae bacterium]